MKDVMTLAVAFFACTIGKVCGMGGGVIIKPVLDALDVYSGLAINFMSCCTVLAMSCFSVVKGKLKGKSSVNWKESSFLAVGAALGGYVGKTRYLMLETYFPDKGIASGIQSCVLLFFLVAVYIYTCNKEHLKSLHVSNPLACVLIGGFLGLLGAFLGIGGGPFNMAVLFLFFSMETKKAAENSIYIIFISQFFAFVKSIANGLADDLNIPILLSMVVCGVIGSELGSRINDRVSNHRSTTLFKGAIIIVGFICISNIYTKLIY